MTASNRLLQNNGRRRMRVLAGLFGAALTWVLQMSLFEPLAANSCADHHTRILPGLWQWLPLALQLFDLAFLAAGSLSCLAAWRMWRDAVGQEAGDGRARFLAKLALMSSFVFWVAILFTACASFLVPPCQSP